VSELLYCPFCGSDQVNLHVDFVCWVACDNCEAAGPPTETHRDDGKVAIELWNKRAQELKK